jgi:PPOX class probable F420-dependent enzyme
MTISQAFPQLQGHQYINLTTYRKSGEGVSTPVWFAVDGDRLYIVTMADAGKVKRIRNNPRVTMTPSDAQGKVKPGAPTVEGQATIQTTQQGERGNQALKRKYGWLYSAFGFYWSIRRATPAYLEIREA